MRGWLDTASAAATASELRSAATQAHTAEDRERADRERVASDDAQLASPQRIQQEIAAEGAVIAEARPGRSSRPPSSRLRRAC